MFLKFRLPIKMLTLIIVLNTMPFPFSESLRNDFSIALTAYTY